MRTVRNVRRTVPFDVPCRGNVKMGQMGQKEKGGKRGIGGKAGMKRGFMRKMEGFGGNRRLHSHFCLSLKICHENC